MRNNAHDGCWALVTMYKAHTAFFIGYLDKRFEKEEPDIDEWICSLFSVGRYREVSLGCIDNVRCMTLLASLQYVLSFRSRAS
jgi:hypothetical protein